MKKILLFLVIFTFAGCNYPTTRFYATDYTQYNEHGFFVSPFSNVEGYKYIPLSSLMIQEPDIDNVSIELMLNKLVAYAQEKGANGLIGVRFSMNLNEGVKAEGIAIKFIDETPATGEPLKPYDYAAAKIFTRETRTPLVSWRNGENGRERMCYDAENNDFIDNKQFIEKYGAVAYSLLCELEQEEKSRRY